MAFSGPTDIIGDLTNETDATISVSGPGPLTFFDDVTNDGEIRVNANAFAKFFGELAGSGTVTGPGTVNMEGDLLPGSSPGVNTFGGNLTFGPFATLNIEALATTTDPVAGPFPGTDNDLITVADTLTLDGTLNVLPLTTAGPIEGTPYGNDYLAITFG